jgi:Ni/Fe-hydrogenase subunit HybB-like protein
VNKSHEQEQESLVERFEWVYLVATAAGGAAVSVDVLVFEHRHMDVIGVVAFASVATVMGVLALLEHKKGRY